MTNPNTTRALTLLANGFAGQFVEYCEGDPRLCEVMNELVIDFISENIPLVDDNQIELAMMMLDRVYVTKTVDS
jgi:hypothetical protein